jgi:hypothetical protein
VAETSSPRTRWIGGSAIIGVACAVAAIASGAGSASGHDAAVPARDSFSGKITSATSRYRGDGGKLSLTIETTAPGPASRAATFTLSGRACHRAHQCIRLQGQLKGTITQVRSPIADIGRQFKLAASGDLKPLGQSRATGTAQGTGFILKGTETIQLSVAGPHGNVDVTATSGPVPGFTSP